MASVSSAARVRRMGRTCSMRRTYAPTCGSVRRWYLPWRSTSAIPPAPGAYLCCSSASAPWRSSREKRVVSSSWPRSRGFSAAKSRASSTPRPPSGGAKRPASASSEPSVCTASCNSSSSVGPGAASASASSSGTASSTSVFKRDSFGGALGQERLRAGEIDFAVLIGLVDADQLQPRHLEEREKGGNHAVPIALVQLGEQAGEGDPLLDPEAVGDGGDAIADGEPLDEDLVGDLDLSPFQDLGERLDQAIDAHLGRLEEADLLLRERQLLLGAADEDVATELRPSAESLRREFVLLVLEQPADELLARVGSRLEPFGVRCLLAGKEEPRLDVRERRRHEQVLARQIEIEIPRPLEVLEVAGGEEGDRDVEDVELVLLDEREEEIERALELRKRHREGRLAGLCGLLVHPFSLT